MIVVGYIIVGVLVCLLAFGLGGFVGFVGRKKIDTKPSAKMLVRSRKVVSIGEYQRERDSVDDQFLRVQEAQYTTRQIFKRDEDLSPTNVVPIEKHAKLR